ncbi:uncharacterized protein LOC124556178 [Schistocerca americana]|uniref:uncharacterized protein LOC124556178 n=1 Tax=Schistocerca americana TaxID=7009 RepID=UPI001F4F927A|nr:uncharacterized protein LOC124556178 [Schistocerca americana]
MASDRHRLIVSREEYDKVLRELSEEELQELSDSCESESEEVVIEEENHSSDSEQSTEETDGHQVEEGRQQTEDYRFYVGKNETICLPCSAYVIAAKEFSAKMKVFDWFVAFLLVNALQGAVQFPIIDDTAPYFDDFPGGESTDAVPLDVSSSDETTSRNTLEPKFSEPVDGSDVLQKSDCSLPPPGCTSTGSTFEEVEFFRITTQKPPKITSPSVETDGTTIGVMVYILIMNNKSQQSLIFCI